jgi:UDP-N-acetylmuramyl tripeptide synthase
VVDGEKRQGSVRAPLIGNFNVANVQLVLTTLTAMGYSLDEACSLLAGAAGAPGRMEPVSLPGSGDARPTVLVDYAHTPDALSKL